MTKDTYRSQFRLPYDLYEALKDAADKNRRSLNAEIVARLGQSFCDGDEGAEIKKRSSLVHDSDGLRMWMETISKEVKQLKIEVSKQSKE